MHKASAFIIFDDYITWPLHSFVANVESAKITCFLISQFSECMIVYFTFRFVPNLSKFLRLYVNLAIVFFSNYMFSSSFPHLKAYSASGCWPCRSCSKLHSSYSCSGNVFLYLILLVFFKRKFLVLFSMDAWMEQIA